MHVLIEQQRPAFDAAIEHLKTELQSLRGNRATPSLVEEVKVEVYGSEMRLKEVASITVPEPRQIVVQPWDNSVLKDIERGLNAANLNMGIQNDGTVLRLTLPPLTTETRQAILKVLGEKLEHSRVQVRQIREKVREDIQKAEREKEMSEDDRFKAQEDLEAVVKGYVDDIKALGDRKSEEIMTV